MIINEYNGVQKTTIQLGKDEKMKKVFMTLVILISFTAFAFAAGGKNQNRHDGDKSQGNPPQHRLGK